MNVLYPVGLDGRWQPCNQAGNQETWILVLVLSLFSSVTLDKAWLFEPLLFSSVKIYLIYLFGPLLESIYIKLQGIDEWSHLKVNLNQIVYQFGRVHDVICWFNFYHSLFCWLSLAGIDNVFFYLSSILWSVCLQPTPCTHCANNKRESMKTL